MIVLTYAVQILIVIASIVSENKDILTVTTFGTFCHLSVICVIYSDLKIVS